MQRRPEDTSDMYDRRSGDPDATLERDRNMAGLDRDGRLKRSPEEEERVSWCVVLLSQTFSWMSNFYYTPCFA